MHRPSFLGPAALLLLVAGSPSQPDVKGQSRPAVRQLALLLQSPIDSYLEPCGCGGQNAGGLARRAALIGELRGQHRDPIVIAVGRFGIDADALPVIVRTLAALGTDAIGLGAEDLIIYDTLRSLADPAGLSLCSLTPPLSAAPPPARGVAVRRGDCLVGVLSVAFGQLGVGELTALAAEELARMRTNGCAFFVLLSHLGETTTARLLEGLPPELRPRLVALATNDDLPVEPIERLDATWVPLAQKGRSLAVVTATPAGDGWTFEVEQRLVTDGPRDPAVQGWVDEFYQRQGRTPAATASPAASETEAVPPVTACLPCHAAAVRGWRGTAHAGAVETLKQASREVAECLRCHDETFRRTGVRAPEGDQGIVCASCHGGLAAHLRGDGPPTTATADTCLTCHDREHSQQFEPASYLAPTALRRHLRFPPPAVNGTASPRPAPNPRRGRMGTGAPSGPGTEYGGDKWGQGLHPAHRGQFRLRPGEAALRPYLYHRRVRPAFHARPLLSQVC